MSDRADFPRMKMVVAVMAAFLMAAPRGIAQAPQPARAGAARIKKERAQDQAAVNRFATRVDVALASTPASKGEWGLLIADAATGETLYELNADKYFVPASNMKLFTTALALAKLGPDFDFTRHWKRMELFRRTERWLGIYFWSGAAIQICRTANFLTRPRKNSTAHRNECWASLRMRSSRRE